MILQALNDYYARSGSMAPAGFEFKEIPFLIVLKPDGSVLDVRDTRSVEGKTRRAKTYTVPKAPKKSVNIASSLLWGNAEYALGLLCDDRKAKQQSFVEKKNKTIHQQKLKDQQRLLEQHMAFKNRIEEALAECADTGLTALHVFLRNLDMGALAAHTAFAEIRTNNAILSFQLAGDAGLIVERPAVVKCLMRVPEKAEEGTIQLIRCLLTGEKDILERLHTPIKRVNGAQTSGADIVSFNHPAFVSFRKERGANSPIGKKAASAYTTALNSLLAKDSKQRIQVGDTSTVFWASKPDTLVQSVFALFAGNGGDDPDAGTQAVSSLYASIQNGAYIESDGEEHFFVLGLAPNAARLSVRFWHAAPVKEFALHIHQYFQDVELQFPAYEKRRFFPLFVLLKSIALQGDPKNIPPQIAGDTLRAIIEGLPFPAALLNCAIQRNKADRQQNSETSPHRFLMRQASRISLIKACLTRQARLNQQPENQLTMSLNLEDKRPPYRLGRLFAALEKIQGDANPGLNATIRERYYGAASASPATVFPLLLRLKNHHLAKLDGGLKTNRERLLREIVGGFSDFPPQMALPEQGLFAIGYYHQMQALYARKNTTPADTETA